MGPLVTLAYSGGLDTSAIVPWLKDVYGARVLCYVADVGQGDRELDGVEEKAVRSGDSGNSSVVGNLRQRKNRIRQRIRSYSSGGDCAGSGLHEPKHISERN